MVDQSQADDGVDPAIATIRAFANTHRGVYPKRDPNFQAPINTAAGNLQYYGGHITSAMSIHPVMWGTGVNSQVQSTMTPFYQAVATSGSGGYWGILNQYNTAGKTPVGGGTGTNQTFSAGSAVAAITITPSVTSKSVDDSQIQAELTAQIKAGKLPMPDAGFNTYYPIFFPPGISITMGGSGSCVAGGFCAYHGTVAAAGGIPEYFYGVHPDMGPGSGCATGCGGSTMINNVTSVASHELMETATDCEVGLATTNGPPLAWYDTTQGEIGDICNAQQGTSGSYTVQKEWSNKDGACVDHTGTCAPNCTGKTCGPDGCGGSCGTCPTGQTCSAGGTCSGCTPNCTNKQCGSNGCGGTCGTCPTGDTCNSSGQCVPGCTPNCSGKMCGSDGCGGSCGTCPTGQTCSAGGTCQGGSTCSGTCSHAVCKTGSHLSKSCSSCAGKVCAADPYCCLVQWDSICVSEVPIYCGGGCGC